MASSIAVGDPAQRAPTTMTSYRFSLMSGSCPQVGTQDVDARARKYRGDPSLTGWFVPGDVGRRLGAVAQPELRQQVAHVVLDGLAGDEQPLADLDVGQPGADQLEDLGFPLRQRPDPLGAGPDGRAQRTQQRAGDVGVPSGVEALEVLQRRLRRGDRDLG